MRVELIYGMGFSKPNGISRYVIELSERLSKEHEVHLLIADNDFNLPGMIIHRNPLSKIPSFKFNSNILYLKSLLHISNITIRLIINALYNPYFSRKIQRRYHIDIIHSQSIDSLSADVVTMHACFKAARKNPEKSTKTPFLLRTLGMISFFPFIYSYLAVEKNILHDSKKIIAVSQKLKDEIIEHYKIPETKIIVIPNGVDLYKFKPDSIKREKIRNRYGISKDDVVLIFVGHMFKAKGLDYIMEAISGIDKVKLFVIGEDQNIKIYKERASKDGIQDKVIFVGKILEGVEDYYAASDIFLLPSASEGFPLTSLEAVATGLPIIATKVAGLEELVEDETNGFFVKRNSEDIRNKIKFLVQNENLRKQMGINARKTSEKYSWDEVERRTSQVYEEVRNL
jgi:UDP-glucose:(heptosyl)LPS alpha-1,3-glucosyltransferase